MGAEKLQKATFKHIEAELYQYPNTVKEIKKRRMELLHPYLEEVDENQGQGVNSVRSISRPTERMATRLTADKRLRNLEEIKEAIESTYDKLDDTQKKLIKLRYWDNNDLNWEGIAFNCNLSRATAFRYKDLIIQTIAEKMGW